MFPELDALVCTLISDVSWAFLVGTSPEEPPYGLLTNLWLFPTRLSTSRFERTNLANSACSKTEFPGTCLRLESGSWSDGLCRTEKCAPDAYECNCNGKSLCKMELCGAWRPKDAVVRPTIGETNVPCRREEGSSVCLSPVQGGAESSTKDTRIVQIGEKSPTTLFNLEPFVDIGDKMKKMWANRTTVHDAWDYRDLLVPRQLNIRLYENEAKTELSVCMTVNTYNYRPKLYEDKWYTVTSEIVGLQGQMLRFTQCDDYERRGRRIISECANVETESSELVSKIRGLEYHTDGWCVGPLRKNGEAIRISLTGVNWLYGINFQNPDGSKHEFLFTKDMQNGLTGKIRKQSGMVARGRIPDIIVNPSGIPV